MTSMKSVSTVLLALLVGGCSTEHYGSGGEAEHVLGTFLPIEHSYSTRSEQALRLDWESQKHLLDLLILNGASHCFPASVKESETREARVLRELMAGMYYDASNLLLVQRNKLAILERRLNSVDGRETCYPKLAGENTRVQGIDKLHELLNSDNQFAIDSDQLNPKYKKRLNEAAEILKKYNTYKLYISGHTDYQGSDVDNVDLSRKRAKNVASYLINLGLKKSEIFVNYFGESAPIYSGKLPHQNLVNRRVEIRVGLDEAKGRI